MFFKQPNPSLKNVDVSDLDGDALVQWQHRYYVWMALMMAFVVPGLVGCLWGDGWGALMYAGLVRLVVVHHATFCVNSLAHYLGDRPYDDRRTPRNHLVTAFITLGEGYHNFHHEFPNDYRNAIKFYQYDPTKWLIQLAFRLGLVWDLKRAPDDVIEKGQINMLQKNLDLRKSNLTWGKADHELPIWNEDEFNEERLLNPFLLRLHGYVYDVSLFIHQHPGGPRVMKPYLGKDATQAFEGQVYLHSTAARHIARTLRIAKMNLR
ncbi:hypothetical protein HMI55_000844 [Coelomomyces lativittatus]|nr:hypothetical protein HMI55_000844 [Coelomomyces lativittatus]